MRSGVSTLQQTLTAEAASILKHSLGLARRRGHAQLTPLHVAATLFTSSSTLRHACLKSQQQNSSSSSSSHILQCRALELCFNVALNRLPTTTTTPLIHQPSLSNALIAALKRAQAHQRRGCIEQNHQQQQQPLLSVKVDLHQLVISILDDPSVSRVMREAGFSSTCVKNNLQQQSSTNPSSIFTSSSSSSSLSLGDNHIEIDPFGHFRQNINQNHFLSSYGSYGNYGSVLFSPQKKPASVFPLQSSKEDVKLVFDVFLRKNKKRNTVIVADSVSLTEGLVGELMGKFERGEVPDELKTTHFIKFQLVSLRFMKREELEINLVSLKRKIDSFALGGVVLYVGDLKWIVDGILNEKEGEEVCDYYNHVDHIVEEIGKLFCEKENVNNSKLWLVATSSYQTYMKCQMRIPSLENQWGLQAVPVPSGGLGLSLHASSVHDSKMSMSYPIMESKLFSNMEENDKLNCCEECIINYEKEAELFKPGQKNLLPSWLQSHSTEAHQKDELIQLKKKWNRLCQCLHQNKQPQNHWSNNTLHINQSSNAKIYPYNSSYPWWPNQTKSSISFADSAAKPAYSSNIIPRFRHQQSCTTIEFNFNNDATQKKQTTTALDSLKEVKITLGLGNSTFNGSERKKVASLIDDTTLQRDYICKLLQENVPWQCETVSAIGEALVDSKSSKESVSWFFFKGSDSVGKKRLALSIAESVFGSLDVFFQFDMLKRENSETPFCEMVSGVLKNHEKFVLLVENVDFGDTLLRKLVADGFENAKFGTLGQGIIILTNGEDQKNESVMKLVLQISENENKPTLELSSSPCLGNKRRAELDLFGKIMKNPRIEENEEGVLVCAKGNKKREFSRQSSFNNTLDLNMEADEEDEDDEGQNSPISSDLTRETVVEPLISNESLDSIENFFEFNGSPIKDKEVKEVFKSRVKESFEEVFGKNCVGKFSVQDKVIEEIGVGCGSFTNKMFEKWLKDIFQKSLEGVISNGWGKGGIVFTLCWDGKEDRKWDSGFMGSCLPKNIQVVNNFMD
ncbi:protein SMAX1-LIKE 4 [Cicer arietinum]|uniref:Protein SMAX1-LIKE 4 n=1 Tax=Cicer arietinum TaxID=3827 RepID=A0A1S2XEA0_CICAR|nr:protein SMAX1-LIKE 4 [Cicer arietinum]